MIRVSTGEGRRREESAYVGDDFDTVVLPDTNTGVGGSEIDTFREGRTVGSSERN
jgi:hypothetical protein